MKKALAFVLAPLSGGYLVTLGIWPDPLPVIDEATALLVLGGSLSVLGIDIRRYLPFIGGRKTRKKSRDEGPVVDI